MRIGQARSAEKGGECLPFDLYSEMHPTRETDVAVSMMGMESVRKPCR